MATKIADRSTYWVSTGGSNPNPYGDYRFYWMIYYEQTDNDRANNRSKVIVETYLQTHFSESNPDDWMASGYTYYPDGTSNVYIDGSLKHSTYVPSGVIYLGESWALAYKTTYSEYLKHNDDGTRSFTWKGTGFGKGTAESTYTLPKIDRPSILGSVSNFNVDSGVTVNSTKYVSSYYDRLKIYAGSTLIKTVNNFTSGKITFTTSELNNIYSVISKDSGTFTFELSSYTNSNYTTQVGSTSSKTATGSLTIVAPSFSSFDYSDINDTTYNLTRDRSKIVKGYSTVTITIPTSKKAVANTRGATISHYLVDGNTLKEGSGSISYPLYNYSKDNVTVQAVDSRGNTSAAINVSFSTLGKYVQYAPLSVEDTYDYVRSDNEIGEIVTINFNGTWWNGSFGSVSNSLNVTYKYKKSTASSYTDGPEGLIVPSTDGTSFSFEGTIEGDTSAKGFDISQSYDIIVTITDKLSSKSITYDLHAGEPAIAIYGNKCALGAAYDESLGGTQIHGQSYIKDNCTIDAACDINGVCNINDECYIAGENIQNFKGTKISSGTSLPSTVTNGSIFILYS